MADNPATASSSKKKRQRMVVIGAGAVVLLALLYLRSRSQAASSANATSPTDLQNAYMQGAQTQAQQDQSLYGSGSSTPSTFADNGANAAALGDAVTQGLSGVQSALSQLQAPPAAVAPASTAPSSPAPTVTVNVSPVDGTVGTGTKASSNTQKTTSPAVAAGRAAGAGKSGAAYNKAFNAAFNKRWLAAHPAGVRR